MTGPERDTLVIGLSVGGALGGALGTWLGYRLCQAVGCVKARRAAKREARVRDNESPDRVGYGRRGAGAKTIPFPSPGAGTVPSEQSAHAVPRKPRVIPLTPKRHAVYTDVAGDPSKVVPVPLPKASGGVSREDAERLVEDWRGAWPEVVRISDDEMHALEARASASETARQIREDALAALTGAGYKRAAAEAALDACTLVERAGGLESWVAAAFRRAAKP